MIDGNGHLGNNRKWYIWANLKASAHIGRKQPGLRSHWLCSAKGMYQHPRAFRFSKEARIPASKVEILK